MLLMNIFFQLMLRTKDLSTFHITLLWAANVHIMITFSHGQRIKNCIMSWCFNFQFIRRNLIGTLFQAALSMKSMRSGTSGASDSNNQGAAQVFTQTGIYRGNTVAIRPIKKTSITMTRDDLLEMKVVSVFISSMKWAVIDQMLS